MRISDWSSDVCSSDLVDGLLMNAPGGLAESKRSIGENARPPLDRQIHERALAAFAAGRGSGQAKEGTAAFLAKRPPRWAEGDRKSTRLTPVTNAHLVCRLLLEKKKQQKHTKPPTKINTDNRLNIH